MAINKALLINLPTEDTSKTEQVIEIKVRELEEQNKDLQEQMNVLAKQVEMMAGFEKSLISAFGEEIDLMQSIYSITPSQTQKQIAKDMALMLNRIQKRWCEGAKYFIDKDKMSIEKA